MILENDSAYEMDSKSSFLIIPNKGSKIDSVGFGEIE